MVKRLVKIVGVDVKVGEVGGEEMNKLTKINL